MTVLDSWCLVRYLEGAEPVAGRVHELLESERPVVSWINLGEVFSVVRRAAGDDAASAVVRDLRDVVMAELPSEQRIVDAARIKAQYPMADADAFAAATAIANDAALWTGDPQLLVAHSPWRWRDVR